MEASALPASVGLARPRIALGASLLRIRSDEQLVWLFRDGNEDAFRVIHDRYRTRMLAYTRQMLAGSRQDPEDAVQEIFVRAYGGLRASNRDLALRAWLYRIAHNRCVDELRRPRPIIAEEVDTSTPSAHDPFVKVQQRDALRRLIADVQRLPDQQRSALLMRELGGMAYADMSGALGVSVPAVKSLLVRARVGLAQASEARDIGCAAIRDDLVQAHDRGVRASGLARRHLRDCRSCREFRSEVRGVSRQFAGLAPVLGPVGVIAHLLGWGSATTGAGAAGGTAAGAAGSGAASAAGTAGAAGAAGAAGVAGSGAAASAGVLAGGMSHVVTLLAAAVVTAGGAVEIQRTLATPAQHRSQHHHVVAPGSRLPAGGSATRPFSGSAVSAPAAPQSPISSSAAVPPPPVALHGSGQRSGTSGPASAAATSSTRPSGLPKSLPISETLDPDRLMYTPHGAPGSSTTGTGTAGTGTTATSTGGTGTGGTGTAGTGAGGATPGPTTAAPGSTTAAPGSTTAAPGSVATPGSPPPGTGSTGASGTGGTTAPGPTGPATTGAGAGGSTSTGAPATGSSVTGAGATGSPIGGSATSGSAVSGSGARSPVSTASGSGGTASAGTGKGASADRTASRRSAGARTGSEGSRSRVGAAPHHVHRARLVVMTLSN